MKINVIKSVNNQTKILAVTKGDLSVIQERAYNFAEKMLEKGTDLLKIEARSRLAVNRLSFSEIYFKLDN